MEDNIIKTNSKNTNTDVVSDNNQSIDLDTIANTFDNNDGLVQIEWNGINIVTKKQLNLDEVRLLVESVVHSCFTNDGADYQPEFLDPALKICALELYTNINIGTDIHKQYNLLYQSDVWNCVYQHINKTQFSEIVKAIENRIQSQVAINANAIQKQLSEMYGMLENMVQKFSDVFEGMEPDAVKKVLAAFSEGGFSEEGLVKAILSNTGTTK